MNILTAPNSLLFWLTLCISLPMLWVAVAHAPWRQLMISPMRQHLFLAAVFSLALLWLLRAPVQGTLAFHPLLMTATMMVFGWCLALVIGAGALVLQEVFRAALNSFSDGWRAAWMQFDLNGFPVDFCLSVAVPVGWAWCVLWLIKRWTFKNPFTYFLGVGFFGAISSCVLMGMGALLLFSITDSEVLLASTQEHFLIFLLLAFPEGFINGALATTFTVFWPDMLKTYQDRWFLKN